MKKLIILTAVLFWTVSCQENSKSKVDTLNTATPNSSRFKNLSFDFSVKTISTSKEEKEIYADIYNNNLDTFYFLNTTSFGIVHRLRYDTTKFLLTPKTFWNESHPYIDKIPPRDHRNFVAILRNKSKETKIKLGFKLIEIEENFDVSKIKTKSSFFSWNTDDSDILWAKEKDIQ